MGIEPAIKPAAENHEGGKIVVMATPITLRRPKFEKLMDCFRDRAEIISMPCPSIVDFVEKDRMDSPELKEYLEEKFARLGGRPADAVVLGCTHYPFIAELIQKAAGPVSYTHLDVYKRQMLSCRAAGMSEKSSPEEEYGSARFSSKLQSVRNRKNGVRPVHSAPVRIGKPFFSHREIRASLTLRAESVLGKILPSSLSNVLTPIRAKFAETWLFECCLLYTSCRIKDITDHMFFL